MANQVLTLSELQRALDRCMTAHPPSGAELRLHADANSIAGLWALMRYEQRDAVQVAEVKPSVLEAFHRWAVSQ